MARALPSSTRFLQPVGKTANWGFPDRLDFEKIDDFFRFKPMPHLLLPGRSAIKGLPEKVFFILRFLPAMMLFSRHSFKQCNILESPGNPLNRL